MWNAHRRRPVPGRAWPRASGDETTTNRSEQMAERAAIVTGASSGIGLAIARVLGKEGYAMTLAARRPEKLQAAADELAREGYDLQAVPANVSEEAEIQRVVASHRERYGRLDVLVNNAGVGSARPSGRFRPSGWTCSWTSICARFPCSIANRWRCSRLPRPSIAARWSSTPPRSRASAGWAGTPCTRPPSTASSASPRR